MPRNIAIRFILALAFLGSLAASAASAGNQLPIEADKQVRWQEGHWAAVPQASPHGHVRQCVLVAIRTRADKAGTHETRLSFVISRGLGLAVIISDAALNVDHFFDDQAELIFDSGKVIGSISFDSGASLMASHPGDPAAMLAALRQAKTLTLRTAGGGVDTGPMELSLPVSALDWLEACGRKFAIPTDQPNDPEAGQFPTPKKRIAVDTSIKPTAAGPAGIADKQKIDNWDASELRAADGTVSTCLIRQHFTADDAEKNRQISVFFSVSRAKGMMISLKMAGLHMLMDSPVPVELTIGDRRFKAFSARAFDAETVGVIPQHGRDLAEALEKAGKFNFKSAGMGFEGTFGSNVIPWLNACARRNGFAFEPAAK